MRRILATTLALALLWGEPSAALTPAKRTIVLGHPSLPLDGVQSVFAAYSLRKLRTAYAGYAVQLERASDSTTKNFGFVGNSLNTAAIASFCASTSCSVSEWYDQGRNGYNLVQATFVSMPPYSAAAIDNLPAMNFGTPDTTIYSLGTNSSVTWSAAAFTGFGVFKALSGHYAYNASLVRIGNLVWLRNVAVSNEANLRGAASGTSAPFYQVSTSGWPDGLAHQQDVTLASASADYYQDRTALSAGTTTLGSNIASETATLYVGGDPTYNPQGYVSEVILIGAVNVPKRQAIRAGERAFWGTP